MPRCRWTWSITTTTIRLHPRFHFCIRGSGNSLEPASSPMTMKMFSPQRVDMVHGVASVELERPAPAAATIILGELDDGVGGAKTRQWRSDAAQRHSSRSRSAINILRVFQTGETALVVRSSTVSIRDLFMGPQPSTRIRSEAASAISTSPVGDPAMAPSHIHIARPRVRFRRLSSAITSRTRPTSRQRCHRHYQFARSRSGERVFAARSLTRNAPTSTSAGSTPDRSESRGHRLRI